MKIKKSLVIIPSALLCLAALSTCGNNSQQDKFVNGFESERFEKYLQLPNNLSSVDYRYGDYTRDQALRNSSRARTVTLTSLKAGTDPFYQYNIDRSGRLNSGGSEYHSPFSISSRSEQLETTAKLYDDEDPVGVINETTKIIRKTATAELTTTNNNFEYTSWVENKGNEKADIYQITRGKSSFLNHDSEGVIPSPTDDLIFKQTLYEDLELKDARRNFKEAVAGNYVRRMVITPIEGNNNFANLEAIAVYIADEPLPIYNKRTVGGGEVNYFADGDNTIYCRFSEIVSTGYVVSPNHTPTQRPTEPDEIKTWIAANRDVLISAYQINETTAKLDRSNNTWLCDYVINANKVYVSADENLVQYNKPYCICSSYICSDVDYNSLGNYGKVDSSKIDQYYPSGLDMQIGIFDNGGEGPDYDNKDTIRYNPNNALFEQGISGIYDYTMSARKAGLIDAKDQNTYFFYGTVGFSSPFKFKEGATSNNISFDLHAINQDDTVDLDILTIVDEDIDYNPKAIMLDNTTVTDKIVANVATLPETCEFIVVIHKNGENDFTVKSCSIDYWSDEGGNV